MKLRIKGNSIRLRFTRTEVAEIAAKGLLESWTDFGNQRFCFGIVAREGESGLSVTFEQDTILVVASQADISHWAEGDDVGLYGQQATSGEDLLSIAVEKDFRCLDRSRAEDDEADAYPHPSLKPKKL